MTAWFGLPVLQLQLGGFVVAVAAMAAVVTMITMRTMTVVVVPIKSLSFPWKITPVNWIFILLRNFINLWSCVDVCFFLSSKKEFLYLSFFFPIVVVFSIISCVSVFFDRRLCWLQPWYVVGVPTTLHQSSAEQTSQQMTYNQFIIDIQFITGFFGVCVFVHNQDISITPGNKVILSSIVGR